MIEVEAYRQSDCWQGFRLSGHAESGPYGYDIVCAAVSALSLSVVNNVKRILDVELIIQADQDQGGYLEFYRPENLSADQQDQLQLLFEHLYWSLYDIEDEYPKFIKIKIQD